MMTTDQSEGHRPASVGGLGVLGGAAVATVASGVVLGVVALLVGGLSAAGGSVVGAIIAAAVLASGTVPMNLVARVMPGLSLGFALLTYLFQLMALVASLVALDRAGLVGDELSRPWLGAAIMIGVATWVVTHVMLAARARIPIYRLDADPGAR